MRKMVVPIIVGAVCLLAVGSPDAAGAAPIDVEGAAQTATSLAQALGLPWGEQVEVVEKSAVGRYADRHHFIVKYFNFAKITIDAADGSIVNVHDWSAFTEFMAQPTKVNVTEEEALARATEIAEAMAMVSDSTPLCEVTLNEFTEGELYQWHVHWRRTANGIPYNSDGAIVMLDPGTGKLLGAGKAFWSAPPESTKVRIEEGEALESARGHARALGIKEADVSPTVELKVVQPNKYWDRASPVHIPHPGFSRVGWVVALKVPSPLGGEGAVGDRVFWIDAADGRLLGGTESRGRT